MICNIELMKHSEQWRGGGGGGEGSVLSTLSNFFNIYCGALDSEFSNL